MNIRTFIATFGLLVCLLAHPAVGGPLDDAAAADDRGDFGTSLEILLPMAKQGNPLAQSMLGFKYQQGLGVLQDYSEALKWLSLAAGNGDAQAQAELAKMYMEGLGVPPDYTKAAKWFGEAAKQGNASAQLFLGLLYYQGLGVPKDFVRAHMWYNLASVGFSQSNAEGRKTAANERDMVAKFMTSEQIAEAQSLARNWKSASKLASAKKKALTENSSSLPVQKVTGAYLFDVLKKPSYRNSWSKLIGNTIDLPNWLKTYSKTFDGPATPGEVFTIKGRKVEMYAICMAHSCSSNNFAVLFKSGGGWAKGVLIVDNGQPRFLGNPSSAERAALLKGPMN